ncbi:hypothetical protein [Sediminibacterium ginsengisoli]|uniref:Uncharacterized protein n=1 Tax=Sediminibacterium ginsengisoli TaxID=413434 RepID=A0A1T4JQ75_9BACT|nr:hypothetical protein [Sediminibacterium ginsengisoli]SJZ32350.1 hypothetical protein SAMN04488132_10170 [Sediminibacterium ginsengisoli]
MKKLIFILLIPLLYGSLSAQKKIVIEDLRSFSMHGLESIYLQTPAIRQTLLRNLNEIVLQHFDCPLADTNSLSVEMLKLPRARTKADFNTSDTNQLHLFLDLYQYRPFDFFLATRATQNDTSVMKSTKTVIRLSALLAKDKNTVLLNKTIDLLLSHGETPGMGIVSENTYLSPKSFLEVLRTGFRLLLDPQDMTEQIGIKATPVFQAENLLMPALSQQQRSVAATQKNGAAFTYNSEREMVRYGDKLYQEIELRGKNPTPLTPFLRNVIEEARNKSRSDFIFLHQELRDVKRDHNYLLKLLIQVGPDTEVSNPLTNFMEGYVHYLLKDKDTIARFSISHNARMRGKFIYPDKVWNGFDTASLHTFSLAQVVPPQPLVAAYQVKGQIGKHMFTINCLGSNTVKEILVDDKRICIVQGRFIPERFVFFDASLSPEILDQLLLIGFSGFLE